MSLTRFWAENRLPFQASQRIFFSLEEAVPAPARPILLVFFSPDCHVCWEELFEMRSFLQILSIPIDIVGISADPREELEAFLAKYGFSGPVVCDRARRLYRRFGVKLEPYRVILKGNEVVYADDYDIDFFLRRERVKQCLLELVSK